MAPEEAKQAFIGQVQGGLERNGPTVFTDAAQRVLGQTYETAYDLNHLYVTDAHLLLALWREFPSTFRNSRGQQVSYWEAQDQLLDDIMPRGDEIIMGERIRTGKLESLLQRAQELAVARGDQAIDSAHILLSLYRFYASGDGDGGEILDRLHVSIERLRDEAELDLDWNTPTDDGTRRGRFDTPS